MTNIRKDKHSKMPDHGIKRSRLGKLLIGVALSCTIFASAIVTPATADEPANTASDTFGQIAELTRELADFSAAELQANNQATLSVTPNGGGPVIPGDSVELRINIENHSSEPLQSTRVEVRIAKASFAEATALSNWSSDQTPLNNENSTYLGQFTAPPIINGESFESSITIPADRTALLSPGVYATSTTDSSGSLHGAGTITVLDSARESMKLSVVIPVIAPPQSRGLLSATMLSELTANGGQLSNVLAGARATEATLAVDPAIPAAIRVLAADAPSTALSWLNELESINNERFPLQFGDADVSAQFAAGLRHPMSVESLAGYQASSSTASVAEASPQPSISQSPQSETESASNSELSVTDLLSVAATNAHGNTIASSIYLPYQRGMSQKVYEALQRLDAEENPPKTLLSSTELSSSSNSASLRASGADFIVYDQQLSDLMQRSFNAQTTAELEQHLSILMANLSFKATSAPQSLVLLAGRDAQLNSNSTRATLNAITEFNAQKLSPLSAQLTDAPQAATVIARPLKTSRAELVTAQLEFEPKLHDFATVISDPALITSTNRAEFLQLLSVGWVSPESYVNSSSKLRQAVTAYNTRALATLNSVELLPTVHTALLSSEATLQYWVRNDLPYEAKLVLETNPDNSRLAVTQFTKFAAPAGSKSAVQVPVNTRLSSGETDVTLTLRSEANVTVGPVRSATVYVQAEEDGVISYLLIGIIVLLISLGLWRTFRRKHRALPDAAAAVSATAEPSTSSPSSSGASE